MASRKLEVVISGDSSQLSRAFNKAGQDVSSFERVGNMAWGSLKAGALIGGAAVAGTAYMIGNSFQDAFGTMQELETLMAQTNAAILSTGGVANVSAESVQNFAGNMEILTGVDDLATQAGENMLLTFTNIRNEVGAGNDIFTQASTTMMDMSVALGQDMTASAMQLGKALQDPVAGVAALQRVGVKLTDDQKKMITTMVEAGDTMGAQKVILGELNREFGGSAAAQGETTIGRWKRFKAAIEDAQMSILGAAMPALNGLTTWMTGHIPDLENFANKLTDIGNRSDLSISAKYDLGLDAFETLLNDLGLSRDTAADVRQGFEMLGPAALGAAHSTEAIAFAFQNLALVGDWALTNLKIGLLDYKESFLSTASLLTTGGLVDFGEDDIKKEMDDLKRHSDELAQKSQDMHAKVEAATQAAGQDWQNMTDIMNKPPIATSGEAWNQHVEAARKAGADSVAAFTMGQVTGQPTADAATASIVASTAGKYTTLPATLFPAGVNAVGAPGLSGGMWAGKPSVDGAAGAIQAVVASAGNVDLFSRGAAVSQSYADGLNSHYDAIAGWVASTRSLVGSVPGGPASLGYDPMPRYASGTDYAPGGWSIVGERGPELINLPRGSQVIPNHRIATSAGAPITFAPGAIQITGATNPEATADAVYRRIMQKLERDTRMN